MNATPTIGTRHDGDVEAYAAVVRGALADLSPAQRDLLIEDLEEHLAEIAAEIDGPLAERLGDPLDYAAELRVSAGFAASRAPRSARLQARARGLRDRVVQQPRWAPAAAFVRSLRPAWNLLRGYLAVLLLAELLNHDGAYSLIPSLSGHFGKVIGVAAVVLAVWASLRLDRRQRRGVPRPVRLLLSAGGVLLLVFGVAQVLTIQNLYESGEAYVANLGPAPVATLAPAQPDGQPDGQPTSDLTTVTNIYAYGPDGQPLSDVRLYDQDGRPIVLPDPWYGDPSVIRTHVLQTDGQLSDNAYPIGREQSGTADEDPYAVYDQNGNLVDPTTRTPTVVPPLLLPSAAPSPVVPHD